jgi:ribosomal protein S18 acetylase RimI-like enzyme
MATRYRNQQSGQIVCSRRLRLLSVRLRAMTGEDASVVQDQQGREMADQSTNTVTFDLRAASDLDAAPLADLRVAVMPPSLEVLGRFDPQRARDRFLAGYVARDTRLICVQGGTAGCVVVRKRSDHHYLDHLYITGAYQGQGIGRRCIETLQLEARDCLLPIRLMALKQSPANAFYRACGFEFVSEEAFDIHYQWTPDF